MHSRLLCCMDCHVFEVSKQNPHPSAPSCHLVTLTQMCTQPLGLEVMPGDTTRWAILASLHWPPSPVQPCGAGLTHTLPPPLCSLPALRLCLELLPEPWESSLRSSLGRVSAPLWTPHPRGLLHLPHPHCQCLFRDPSVPIPSAGRELLRGRSQLACPLCPQQ